MPMVAMRQLLDHAAENNYGVGAFNVNNMEQIQAILEAAKETDSPVIIQASRGARKYTNDRFLYHPEKKITTAVIITNHTLAFTIPALATVGAACWGAVYFAQTFWRDFCTPEDKDIPPAYTESVV